MALLGLFSKKDKQKLPNPSTNSSGASVADASSVAETSEYVLPDIPDISGRTYGQQAEASSSKFHLGFHRKRSTPAAEATESHQLRPPQAPLTQSSRSEAHLDKIRPPPSRAALFSTYGDPQNALSTRSLPNQPDARSRTSHEMGDPASRSSTDNAPVPKKSGGGLFSWAHRERKKSKPTDTPPQLNVDVSSDSFNLKSFRHVGPESPVSDSTLPSPPLLVPPARPRPRGDSTGSDSSQRISVAAFREMAARKSTFNSANSSPVLLRPPSRSDSLENAKLRTSPSSFSHSPIPMRSSTLALSNASTSSDSEPSESESEDSGGSATMRPRRQRTITKERPVAKASSELGHRYASAIPPRPPPKSVGGHSEYRTDSAPSQRPMVGTSQRMYQSGTSVSTSALQLSAEKHAPPKTSPQVTNPAIARARPKSVARDSDSDESSNASSDDSDDAPLASLVRPPRPGSSASNATSGSRSRAPAKPLIDISQLNAPPMPVLASTVDKSFAPPTKQSPPAPPVPDKGSSNEKAREARSDKPPLSDRLARIAQNAAGKSVETLATAMPLERRSLDSRPLLSDTNERGRMAQPARSQTAPMDAFDPTPSSSPSAVKSKPKPNGRSLSSPNAAAAYDLTDPTPIVPTPIRERSPPPSFSVTSRPPSQISLNPSSRLSNSQATVRMVGSSSASSSPSSSTFPSSPSAAPLSSAGSSTASFGNRTSYFSSTSAAPAPHSASSSTPASQPSRAAPAPRQRSSTLIPDTTLPSMAGFTGSGLLSTPAAIPADPKARPSPASRTARQRSSTMLPRMEITPAPRPQADRESATGGSSRQSPPSSSSTVQHQPQPQAAAQRFPQRSRQPFDQSSTTTNSSQQQPSSVAPPRKPFAAMERGNSPASSTGDSSSGRTPLTPADGSDYGYGDSRSAISGVSAVRKGHRRGASVTFEDEPEKGHVTKSSGDDEERRKERRRGEAKAAIELGKVVNGHITLNDDDDLPLNGMGQRLSVVNPMLNFTPPSPIAWSTSPSMPMMAPPPFMTPPGANDPRFLAAHQHAMMVAKQAYQMAVAQQAMAAANDEWERGSSASAYGNMGMGMNPVGMGLGMPMGVMPMGSMLPGGYGMNYPMFPSTASMYAGSVAGSDIGVGWGSRSEYGGPSRVSRTSAMFSDRTSAYGGLTANQRSGSHGQLAPNAASARPAVRPRTKTAPSDTPLPPQHARARQGPPSSWKVSGK